MDYNKKFDFLKQDIDSSIEEHNSYGFWDGTIYNISAVLAISLSAAAALLPTDWGVYAKTMTGLAAILIALDRSLNWGKRWLYHREMKHEYLIVKAKISFYQNMPDGFTQEEIKKHYEEIYYDLYKVRLKEVKMPGVSGLEE